VAWLGDARASKQRARTIARKVLGQLTHPDATSQSRRPPGRWRRRTRGRPASTAQVTRLLAHQPDALLDRQPGGRDGTVRRVGCLRAPGSSQNRPATPCTTPRPGQSSVNRAWLKRTSGIGAGGAWIYRMLRSGYSPWPKHGEPCRPGVAGPARPRWKVSCSTMSASSPAVALTSTSDAHRRHAARVRAGCAMCRAAAVVYDWPVATGLTPAGPARSRWLAAVSAVRSRTM
jgi:hypothetical protein